MHASRFKIQFRNGVLTALFTFLMFAFAPLGNIALAQDDTVRIGGDYKFITLREGAESSECRRACKNDVSCKAWTFIKQRTRAREGVNLNLGPDLNIGFGGRVEIIPPQCRLKHSVGQKLTNECCISGVKKVVRRRESNKAERCADYAEKALDQQDANLTRRCSYRGNRWHGDYRTHYNWCMKSSKRTSQRETEVRSDQLDECRGGRRNRDASCDQYASTALDILEQVRANDCRSQTDRSWNKEYERVYEWCIDRRPRKRRAVMERAQAKLAACIRRGGGERIERCETYADDALEQVREAGKYDCRTSGTSWSNEYKVHYQACRKGGRREMRSKRKLRHTYIKRCIRHAEQPRVMETGVISVRQRRLRQWHTVRLTKRFENPVVIAGPVSFNGRDPAHVRVRRVTSRGFEFRIEEFGKDGRHASETVSYMVVEKGVHRFKGMRIEAGTILTGAGLAKREWSRVDLSHRWREKPVVLAQTQTFNGGDPVSARIKEVSTRGFDVTLSEQESDRRGHKREVIAFVAMTQGRYKIEGSRTDNANLYSGRVSRVNHDWRDVRLPVSFSGERPSVFAMAQTSNGADTFDVRYRRLRERSVQIRLQEEQSKDRETRHANEVLGVIALPFGKYWAVSSRHVEDQVARDRDDDRDWGQGDHGTLKINLKNCRDYSRRSVLQFTRARRLSCGFTGKNWHSNERRHRRWCRNNGLGAATDMAVSRHERMVSCKARAKDRPARRTGWVSLGCSRASLRRDRDTITVNRRMGRFSSLQLRVDRGKVKIYEARVTFGNGKTQVLPVTGKLGRGTVTRPIDLTGKRRFISEIRLNYKSVASFPPREANVCVFGRE